MNQFVESRLMEVAEAFVRRVVQTLDEEGTLEDLFVELHENGPDEFDAMVLNDFLSNDDLNGMLAAAWGEVFCQEFRHDNEDMWEARELVAGLTHNLLSH